jgi:hypothetical protein
MVRITPSVTRERHLPLDTEGVAMCYEFDELYRKVQEEEERRKKARESKDGSPAPAKPAPEVKPREPVPA